ncbi:hypothetical protein MSj_01841 [Microcystis aeruginosa Sj]|uniref:Transposase IS204/IS1001/IS1096/IS1165 DDE domain-containing protein n=3 Tax=Microcystis aeruginosa TaxID=1126 RepID=A0A2Z6USL8_MICAE|nr:hypothetical protein MSj_01841 [Microcystis aeruginosa Sj]
MEGLNNRSRVILRQTYGLRNLALRFVLCNGQDYKR